MPSTLLIRADASVSIGTGHIMRMIALAQAWRDEGGEAVFICAEITPALEAWLKEDGFLLEKIQASPGSREDLEETSAAIARYGLDSIPVALDGYQFDADFQLGLKKAGCRLLVMDDYGHAAFYHAEWVLNQNISAREELYANRAPHTRLLLGTNSDSREKWSKPASLPTG
jgi:UDP-2,4-diacetamido-2,4,6-trideoxy-beta-L-altropyranose hydrolase